MKGCFIRQATTSTFWSWKSLRYLGAEVLLDAFVFKSKTLSLAIELEADYAEAFYYRGKAYIGIGNYESALTDLDEAIKLDSTLKDAYIARADVKSALGDEEGSEADLEMAESLE